MVKVFKTNIDNAEEADSIKNKILEYFPYYKINFDLEDCDKILRVEVNISPNAIIDIVKEHNYICKVLE
jgi:hypothetical protein